MRILRWHVAYDGVDIAGSITRQMNRLPPNQQNGVYITKSMST